jgi:hypothetical protein
MCLRGYSSGFVIHLRSYLYTWHVPSVKNANRIQNTEYRVIEESKASAHDKERIKNGCALLKLLLPFLAQIYLEGLDLITDCVLNVNLIWIISNEIRCSVLRKSRRVCLLCRCC